MDAVPVFPAGKYGASITAAGDPPPAPLPAVLPPGLPARFHRAAAIPSPCCKRMASRFFTSTDFLWKCKTIIIEIN